MAAAVHCEAAPSRWHKSVAEAQKQARANKQLIFVDLFADWCGWCHKAEREIFPAAKFQDATKDLVLLRVDTEDRGEGTKMATQYGVTSLPTFLLLTHDGAIAGTIRGYLPVNEFVGELKRVRDEYAKFTKLLAQEKTFERDDPRRLEVVRQLIARRDFTQADIRLQKLVADRKVAQKTRDEAHYQLAASQMVQKNYAAATTTLKTFLKLGRTSEFIEKARILLGQVYLDQRNYKAALDEFRSFRKSYPNSTYIAAVDQLLPQLEQRVARGQ